MNENSVWKKAQNIKLNVADDIKPEFDIGFDDAVPDDTRKELTDFIDWVEANFAIPVTLWVDFEYKHYLVKRDGKRVGFIIYHSDFNNYPNFDNFNDIPQIRLPVRKEHYTIDEILLSFIEAIFYYYAWICNEIESYKPNNDDADEILEMYLKSKK